MTDLYLPVILGTARAGRRSEGVARAVVDAIKDRDILTSLIDVADFPLTETGGDLPQLRGYREQVSAADGLVIVAPEYNHGYPGELKLLIDAEYEAYDRKPVGLVSVSAGKVGGTRLTEQLKLVADGLGMVSVGPTVHVTEVASSERWFESGPLAEALQMMLDELVWYAVALRSARVG